MCTAERKLNILVVIGLLFLPPLFFFTLGVERAAVYSIFTSIILLWITEALPLPATGLLVPILISLYGAMPAANAFSAFGNDILFLFLGCFLMGRSMEKHGLDKRIAYVLLGRFMPGTSFASINITIAATAFLLSMWISNTSATAIVSAVTVGIIRSLSHYVSEQNIRRKVAARLLLSCAFAASIGGLATPVGSPPNLIALGFLEQKGIKISFLEWMKMGLPISIFMLVCLLLIFSLVFPLRGLAFPEIKQEFQKKLLELGPMGAPERQIGGIFLITVGLWILPGLLAGVFPTVAWIGTLNSMLSMSVVGLVGGVLTFALPIKEEGRILRNLEWSETDSIEWGTLMLFGGGLTLGMLLEQSGTAKQLSDSLFGSGIVGPVQLGILVVVCSIVLSEFASNTASASILIPLILAATGTQGASLESAGALALVATFGASFGFMFPISTPPNAIVYATGEVSAVDMRRIGFIFDLIGGAAIVAYFLVVIT